MILQHPGHFKDKAARDRFVEGWQTASVGANRHKTRVLEYGMEPKTIAMTNEQSQFLETMRYQDTDIARMFNIPLHKISIMEATTFSNIEQQAIEYVTDTLMPWAVRWTQCIKRDLIRQRTVFAEQSFNALLRGDTEQRFRAYAIGRNWGWLSANDVRRKENENSIGEKGDEYDQAELFTDGQTPKNGAGNGKTIPGL
jgi:HK97 family phage portal protein